ncbi:hypothetical protein BDU57DRAFT_525325 [Ampelomyces quisqualis]|uniref:Uncharacterized protein n=1 Tax=Ampelomyces quisqualis TaxID=50730 RepID=A0A6A5R035_AMPQU|nr:hypothetical protein BDU57DRAFT_525325 [Ampelomyces quisqualis]
MKGHFMGKIFSAPKGKTLNPASIPEKESGFFVGIPTLWSPPMVKLRVPNSGDGIGAHYDYSPIIPSNAVEITFDHLLRKARREDRVASLYEFNEHDYRRFVEKIKDALDSNGLLSPAAREAGNMTKATPRK